MKSLIPIRLSVSRRSMWRATAAWLVGAFALVLGLSACASQSDRSLPAAVPLAATPTPNSPPSSTVVPGKTSDSPAEPAAAQVITGFNVRGWT